jgi:hypothetical protein
MELNRWIDYRQRGENKSMVSISDAASKEITRVLTSERAKGKMLFVSFVGYG